MRYSALPEWIPKRSHTPTKEQIIAYVEDKESGPVFPLVFYWALINHFRDKGTDRKRLRRYIRELLREGRLHASYPLELGPSGYNNPLISTVPFREEDET